MSGLYVQRSSKRKPKWGIILFILIFTGLVLGVRAYIKSVVNDEWSSSEKISREEVETYQDLEKETVTVNEERPEDRDNTMALEDEKENTFELPLEDEIKLAQLIDQDDENEAEEKNENNDADNNDDEKNNSKNKYYTNFSNTFFNYPHKTKSNDQNKTKKSNSSDLENLRKWKKKSPVIVENYNDKSESKTDKQLPFEKNNKIRIVKSKNNETKPTVKNKTRNNKTKKNVKPINNEPSDESDNNNEEDDLQPKEKIIKKEVVKKVKVNNTKSKTIKPDSKSKASNSEKILDQLEKIEKLQKLYEPKTNKVNKVKKSTTKKNNNTKPDNKTKTKTTDGVTLEEILSIED